MKMKKIIIQLINTFKYNRNTFIKRSVINYRNKRKTINYNKAINSLTAEQLKIYNLVYDLVINNRTAIRFDPEDEETLLILPDVLVAFKGFKIKIDNSHLFVPTTFPTDAYNILLKIVHKEGHRERRKLKYEAKKRINNLLDKFIEKRRENMMFIK